MDYLREVLERQEALLRRLMAGERDTERGETETVHRTERTLQMPEGDGETGAHRAAAAAAAETETVPSPDRRGMRSEPVEPLTEAVLLDEEALETQAAEFRRYRRSDALWREAAPTVWLEPVSLAETAVDVERISRAVQRDARRYDGGFTMY